MSDPTGHARLLRALELVTAWADDHDLGLWMRLTADVTTTAAWEHIATDLAQLVYLVAGLDDRVTAREVLQGVALALAKGEDDTPA